MGTLNGNCQTVVLHFYLLFQSEFFRSQVTENPMQTDLGYLKEGVYWHMNRCDIASSCALIHGLTHITTK